MSFLTDYYGKFNEDKRLRSRYGQVEYLTTMAKLHEIIGERKKLRILDIGAGTGVYSIPLSGEGHDVTAVELVNYNLGILRQKAERMGLTLTARHGNALKLSMIPDGTFDIVLLFGPLYHLFKKEEKVQALREASAKLKQDGVLFAGYIMNDYAVLKYGFLEGHIRDSLTEGKVTEDFRVTNTEEDLFSYDCLSDIREYREEAGLTLLKRFSQDGPVHYFRREISAMDDADFDLFMEYHLSRCEQEELLGAGCHTAEIMIKNRFTYKRS